MAARKSNTSGFSRVSGSGKNLSDHDLAERMRKILQGSARGASVTKAYADFAHKHAAEFAREMGISLDGESEKQ